MAGLPDIILQGAAMVNQSIQHQQRMKAEEDRNKLRQSQWEESLKWRQQAMEAKVATKEEDIKQKQLQIESLELRVKEQQREGVQFTRKEAHTTIQMREGAPYAEFTNDQLIGQIDKLKRQNIDLLRDASLIIERNPQSPAAQQMKGIQNELDAKTAELTTRADLFSKQYNANLDPDGLKAIHTTVNSTRNYLQGTAAQGGIPLSSAASPDQSKINDFVSAMVQEMANRAGNKDAANEMVEDVLKWTEGSAASFGTTPASMMNQLLEGLRVSNDPNAELLRTRLSNFQQ